MFAKFFTFFVSFAAYSFWFGSWKFGLGLRPADPRARARPRRRGEAAGSARASLPTFIPFFGAYVTVQKAGLAPWRSALISLAGPLRGRTRRGGWSGRSAPPRTRTWLVVLANIGFLLNAFNLLPIGFLDGGTAFRSITGVAARLDPLRGRRPGRGCRARPGARRARRVLYVLLAVALVGCLLATRHSGML